MLEAKFDQKFIKDYYNNLLKMTFDKFITFITNNIYIEIIKFIIESHYDVKFNYNFKN